MSEYFSFQDSDKDQNFETFTDVFWIVGIHDYMVTSAKVRSFVDFLNSTSYEHTLKKDCYNWNYPNEDDNSFEVNCHFVDDGVKFSESNLWYRSQDIG